MRLFEYESKDLLVEAGIPIPRGSLVASVEELDELGKDLFPAVLKAQVLTGGRMKAGAIVFADDLEQAKKALSGLLGKDVNGQICERVLVESRADVKREYYLGVTYDSAAKDPIAIFSLSGGIDVEQGGQVQKALFPALLPVAPFRLKEILVAAGVRGKQLGTLTSIFAKLTNLFVQRDCLLIEINPLVEAADGSFVAVDCHVDLDDDALYRQSGLVKKYGLTDRKTGVREKTPFELAAEKIDSADHHGVAGRVVEFTGSLGLLIGGGGASLTAFDAIRRHGGSPANYCEIGGNPSVWKVKELTKLILSRPGVDRVAVIMNVVSNTRVDLVARGVIKGILELGLDPSEKIAIFRIPGAWEDDGFAILRKYGVNYADRTASIDEAARLAVTGGRAS